MQWEEFKLLWLLLHKDNLLKGIPAQIKTESLLVEEQVTKKLYSDYSAFKQQLWQDMVANNPGLDELLLYKKSQKLLDRFLFIFFAEDKGLLPPNSISEIVKQWDKLTEMDEYRPLYDRFKKYFGYMNIGRVQPGKAEIHAYNGGLFAPDELLDSLQISDALLKTHVSKLTEYDFESEVDTNILGHIFEHSLNDIENVRASLDGTRVDKSKTKRKKDGVFYTPKYITKYIVDNTVGKLCTEKKAELEIIDEEFSRGKVYKTKDAEQKRKIELRDKLNSYRNWLLQLAICDPACGSGAFLNQVLEFLMTEHRYLDELESMLFGSSIVFPNVENHILENNIFGVDINEESVEIARLSLWLRTAQKGRKLSTLSSNIKVGNSLIDDPAVAGDLAFNWQAQFPKVFAKGGFDVVVGNPPYVGEKGHSEIFNALKAIPKWLEYYRRRSNLYYFFVKLGTELLKESGLQSFIVPREFISADWSNKVRYEILNKSKLISIVDFNDIKVFDDAGTTSLILSLSKSIENKAYEFDFISIRDTELVTSQLFDKSFISKYSVDNLDLTGYKPWNFYQDEFDSFNSECTLSSYFDVSQGLVTGSDKVTQKHIVNNLVSNSYLGRGIFILTKNIDIKIINGNYQLLIRDKWVPILKEEERFIKPFIKTENLNKWYVSESSNYIIHTGTLSLTDTIKDYLLQFSGILLNRSTITPEGEIINLFDFENFTLNDIKEKYSSAGAVQKIMRRKQWWLPLYERGDVPFEEPKIIVNTKNMDKFTFSDGAHYSSGGGSGGQNYIYLKKGCLEKIVGFTDLLNFTKFTNAILNSKLLQKYIIDGQYNQLSIAKIGDLPFLPFQKIYQNPTYNLINNKADAITQLLIQLDTLSISFTDFIKSKVLLELDKSFLIDSIEILDYFSKNKVNPSISEQAEWMAYFNEQKAKALALQADITRLDREIDALVYALYGLTEEEIRIVEGGTE